MTSRTGRRRTGQLSHRRAPVPARRVVTAGTVLSVLAFGGYSGYIGYGGATATATAQAGAVGGSAGAEPLPTPLATSVHASGGTWATVPMGDLGQPLNTFWQLLFRPDGSASWSDRVEATAVATNGGLVLAGGGQALVVGVRPSNLLTFSPLIATTNAGRSWSNGLLSQGLAPRPAALATGPGQTLAIVEGRGGTKVVRATGNLLSWHPVTTARALASGSSGHACDPEAVTAVGYLSTAPVVGTSCGRLGQAGIFVQNGSAWLPGGPAIPPGSGRAEVLGLFPEGGGLAALIGLSTAGSGGGAKATTQTSLIASWASSSGPGPSGKWRSSAPLSLGTGKSLVSFGPTAAGGIFAVLTSPNGALELAVAPNPSAGWDQLPAPPLTTATVAFLRGGTVDALAVKRTVLTVWALPPGTSRWAKAQILNVPIQFGSSS
jgi:hypothetical protein